MLWHVNVNDSTFIYTTCTEKDVGYQRIRGAGGKLYSYLIDQNNKKSPRNENHSWYSFTKCMMHVHTNGIYS